MKKTAGTSPRGLCEDERCERGDVAAVARTMAQLDDAKYAKSLLKKLRQIEELKALRRLDAAQRQKLRGEAALRAKLAELGVDVPPPSTPALSPRELRDRIGAATSAAEVLDGMLRTIVAVLVLDGVHAIDLGWSPVPYPPTDVADAPGAPSNQSSRPNADS